MKKPGIVKIVKIVATNQEELDVRLCQRKLKIDKSEEGFTNRSRSLMGC